MLTQWPIDLQRVSPWLAPVVIAMVFGLVAGGLVYGSVTLAVRLASSG